MTATLGEKRDYVLDEIMKYGIDVSQRLIYFGEVDDNKEDGDDYGDVCTSSIEYVIRKFNKFIATDATKPIHFWMSSPGGDLYDALRLYDRVMTCPCPVIFYGSGRIMSAASLILCICDERNLFENSAVLVHHGSTSLGGNHPDVQIDMIECERLSRAICQIYADNTFIHNIDFWNDLLQRDVSMSASEAITLGLADNVIEPLDRNMFRAGRTSKIPDQPKIDLIIKDLYARTKRSSDKIVVTPTSNVNTEIVEQITAEKIVRKRRKKV